MTARFLDAGGLLLIWPEVPSALASYACERARCTLPTAAFRVDGSIGVPDPRVPAPSADGESRDAA